MLVHDGVSTTAVNKPKLLERKEKNSDGIIYAGDELAKIFDRFYVVDMAGAQEGTGLGLAIAKTLVASQKGSLSVRSTVDHGITFRVYPEMFCGDPSCRCNWHSHREFQDGVLG